MLVIGEASTNPAIPAASDPNPYANSEYGLKQGQADDAQNFADEPLGIDPVRLLEIVRDVCTLAGEYRTEMGIEYGNPEPRWGSWAWWRRIARSEYAGRFAHRYLTGYGGVFDVPGGNLSLSVPARFVSTRAAGHADNLVGTDPFLAAMPAESDDKDEEELSKEVEIKLQEELSRSNIRGVVREAIRVALTENEAPIKLSWVTEKTQRPELRPVAVYPQPQEAPAVPGVEDQEATEPPAEEDSERPQVEAQEPHARPIKTPKGDFIFQHDATVLCLADQQTGAFTSLYAPGSQVPQGQYVQVRLKKEPAFVFDPETMLGPDQQPVFQTIPGLIGTDTTRDCLVAADLQFEDFLYDIKAASLMDSPLMIHVYDDELDRVLAAYGQNSDPMKKYDPLFAYLPEEDTPKSGASQPKRENGEYYSMQGSTVRKKCNVHESYYRVRLNPDDQNETWLFLVIDFARQIPLHAEYLGNMRLKRPPFGIIRGLESVPSRAYGVGIYQKFHERNLAIDYWFNRAKLKTTKTATAQFIQPDAFVEAQDAQNFAMGGTQFWRIRSDLNGTAINEKNPPIFQKNFMEQVDKEWEMIEKIVQTGQNEFGTDDIGALQDEGAQIAKDATATATRNLERKGNTLQRATENMMVEDLTDLMELAIDIVLENADLDSMQFTEDGKLLAGLNRDAIRNLPRQVRLLLTKARSSESLANNQQAVALIQQYYSLPMSLRKNVRECYMAMLRSLDVQDADNILEEPTDEEIAAEAQQPQPNPHPVESIGIKLADLLPSEQAQALSQIQITADPMRTQAPAVMPGAPPLAPNDPTHTAPHVMPPVQAA